MGGKLSVKRKRKEHKQKVRIRPKLREPHTDYEEFEVSTYRDKFVSDLYENVSQGGDFVHEIYDNVSHGGDFVPHQANVVAHNVISEDSRSGTTYEEKCYDPQDPTLTFADGEDEMDFLCNEYKSLRAKMSCGHVVTPMSLTDWCLRLLDDEGKCEFVCGNCEAEWSFDEVSKMALLTPEEVEEFEKKIFHNAAKNFLDIKQCPGCKSRVVRNDLSNLNVECSVCTVSKRRTYRFCWQCLREWKGRAPRSDRCDNDGCPDPLDILKNCPDIVFKDVKGVDSCPCIRACPTCGMLVEHNKKQCKSMVCPRCKVKFCFVCLKKNKDCLQDNAYILCPAGVAPRQRSIPVWKRT
ncbi:probable E3 ubiquitin-protein ligase ARI5 [Acanthopagrus latus]|uniref:probable E3 ubiquitin-protein ligase ARI5 n=1 Tax=Acanthopagrus latus TaxID=8177 RepID=UPI00187BFD18|nr:probable E3 ubiquitin-protein ligase ARI5 [Acanthopagrus latus]